ncbi:MAG: hypothetical protein M1834_005112 [Cirrosporium novae-zelandiae]|nr:MAG: hypothetical protein M1834_005112 [Cirrosporium novae-zelandiae]
MRLLKPYALYTRFENSPISTLSWSIMLPLILAFMCSVSEASHHRWSQYSMQPQIKRTTSSPRLVDFQVSEPVFTPQGTSNSYGCVETKTLMEHTFAYSYGNPYVGNYTPPTCDFHRVTINLTVTSSGRQYDRLGIMYLGDIEVFRTSTSEPTTNGIIWTYIKEMDQYNALWNEPQKLIFDLGNIVNSVYTGKWNTTLTATFFTIPDSRSRADKILPISSRSSSSDSASVFTVPSDNASVTYIFPRNLKRAVVSLSACGQSAEEFWSGNVLSSQVDTFSDTTGTLYGYSPFREVQLLIDGMLAGVCWPFPIIFTGGVVPGLWRPIAGIDAYDLRQHEIDITPWLGLLSDGTNHTFEIRVAGLNDDGSGNAWVTDTVGSYWLVTGTIFLFSDSNSSITAGTQPTLSLPALEISVSSTLTQTSNGTNTSITYDVEVTREISISSTIKTSAGNETVYWTQKLSFLNSGVLVDEGEVQWNTQSTNGTDASASGYSRVYAYPQFINSTYSYDTDDHLHLWANVNRSLDLDIYGPSVFPSGIQTFNMTSPVNVSLGSKFLQVKVPADLPYFGGALLSTTQNGTGTYQATANGSTSSGTTEQDFTFKGAYMDSPETEIELYHRHVLAVNASVVEDHQSVAGSSQYADQTNYHGQEIWLPSFSVRSLLGRGPGKPKDQLLEKKDVKRS